MENLLNLPDIKVIEYYQNSKNKVFIVVETTETSVACKCCGKQLHKKHGADKKRSLRHLPVFGHPTYIVYKPNRYICSDCKSNPTTTATPSWHKPNASCTTEYESYLMMQLINSTLADVSMKEDIDDSTLQNIMNKYITGKVDWDVIEHLGVIGIDEITLKKGHKDYRTIITCKHDNKIRVLAVLPNRKKATVKAFLKKIPKRLKKTVEAVCTDMYDGYVYAVKEVFRKKTILIIDRYHVAKLYRAALDEYRKSVQGTLKKMLPAKEYAKLKGAMHILRKGKEYASKKDKEVVLELFSHSPELADAYDLALKLTHIFNKHQSRQQALLAINAWTRKVKASKLRCFNTFLKTLCKYKQSIVNYFINRHNSGFVEGINNKIKVLKRRCYGIRNVKHLFQRMHLDFSGYRLYAAKSLC